MSKYILIFLFCSSQLSCQTKIDMTKEINAEYKQLKALKEKINNDELVKKYSGFDTLFIVFKESKNMKKYEFEENKHKTTKYIFFNKDLSMLSFVHKKYFDFDQLASNDSSIIIRKNKKFIRKNKKRVLTNRFFENKKNLDIYYFRQRLYEVLSSKKNIFIIDEDEFDGKEIILKQIMVGGF